MPKIFNAELESAATRFIKVYTLCQKCFLFDVPNIFLWNKFNHRQLIKLKLKLIIILTPLVNIIANLLYLLIFYVYVYLCAQIIFDFDPTTTGYFVSAQKRCPKQ
ncbi:hypothetical protein V1477_002767 [Vespula maculifrons]|uniref:Uncharacterized protein n=1 Tax=Vespula maculifrons TaxID=7453 RepID=A0ABD2CVJ2_VESMC